MPRSFATLLFLILVLGSDPVAAQWSIPAALEVQVGYAIPRGEFGRGETGARPEAGPRFAVGGHVRVSHVLALYANYYRTRFACANCTLLELDGSMISQGGEVGIDVRPVPLHLGARPWLRGGAVYQTLTFSAAAERMTSRAGVGFSLAAGLDVPLHRHVSLTPGVKFVAAPADFEFSAAPARSLEVRALTLEIGVAVHIGGGGE